MLSNVLFFCFLFFNIYLGVECGIVNVPFHLVFLTSDLVSGPVTLGVRSSLPIDGVHFLLGNDS